MKKYKRIEARNGYKIVTKINESGKFVQYCECETKTGEIYAYNFFKSDIYAMGWSSTKEFLKSRKGFLMEA